MKGKTKRTRSVSIRRLDRGPARRKGGIAGAFPYRSRGKRRSCACGQVADRKTVSGWVCSRCWTLEHRGYDRFTGVLRRDLVEEGGPVHDNG